MPGHDQLAKDLVRTFFRDFLGLAAPETADRLHLEEASFLDTQSATDWPAGRRREMDLLARVPSSTEGQTPVLIHVEIERRARTGMDVRMWLYYMQLRLRHGLLVVPILLNLRGGAPGVSRALMAEGFDCVETYIELSGQDAAEHARLAEQAENREAIAMEMTWADKMEAKYRRAGQAEGLESLRAVVLHLLEQRFGPLPERVKRRVKRLRTLRSLRRIAEQVLVAGSLRDLGLS